MRNTGNFLENVTYSYMFSIEVGAQWTQSTGCPILAKVFHAIKIDEEGVGDGKGGNDRIPPFGRPASAMEMPAIWYLACQPPRRRCEWMRTHNGNRRNQFSISQFWNSRYILAMSIILLFVCIIGFGIPVEPDE
jgi:hypothetical protein